MSSQRGNAVRSRPQKHTNRRVFKNNLHDTNIRTKRINQIQINNVCDRCKAILEWKIKYKKYKLLKALKACNKCNEKAVKQPYHTICQPCADQCKVCPKCVTPFSRNQENAEENNNLEPQRISSNYDQILYSTSFDRFEPYSLCSSGLKSKKLIRKAIMGVLN